MTGKKWLLYTATILTIIVLYIMMVIYRIETNPYIWTLNTADDSMLVGGVGGSYGGMSRWKLNRSFPTTIDVVSGFGSAPRYVTVPKLTYDAAGNGINADYQLGLLYQGEVYYYNSIITIRNDRQSAPQLIFYFNIHVAGTFVLLRTDYGGTPKIVGTVQVNGMNYVKFDNGNSGS